MGLSTPEEIREFQRKLYRKAKQEPQFQFYSLRDKVQHPGVLRWAYRKCREKDKAPGVDGETFEDIEEEGPQKWLDELRHELASGEYSPDPVRRKQIQKPGGGMRPLGIPTIKDRVVQMATKIIIEPIFEADMRDGAYGYRPDRSAQDAVKRLHETVRDGKREVVDADISSYFEEIPHKQLIKSVGNRISDGAVMSLIKGWLKAPVQYTDEDGNTRTDKGKASKKGTPQGGVISPLLANIYFNRMLKLWEQHGKAEQLDAEFINYADDFVIATNGNAEEALEWVSKALEKLGLQLNQEKTSIRKVDEEEKVKFLGYQVGWKRYKKKGSLYIALEPSRDSLDRFKEGLKKFLRSRVHIRWKEVYRKLRRKLVGWVNYYSLGTCRDAFREINRYMMNRLKWYFRRTGRTFTESVTSAVEDLVQRSLSLFKLVDR